MIVLTTSTSAQTFSFIPRFENYTTMSITDEQTNKTTSISITSSTQGGYVNTVTATFALVEGHTYTLLLKNGANPNLKDKDETTALMMGILEKLIFNLKLI